jgi:hypothetical protein
MVLVCTEPLTEMSTRNLPGDKVRPARKTDNLTAICESIVLKMWKPRCLTTLWDSTACYRDSFTFAISGRNKKVFICVQSAPATPVNARRQ